jgi:hypothetical protein
MIHPPKHMADDTTAAGQAAEARKLIIQAAEYVNTIRWNATDAHLVRSYNARVAALPETAAKLPDLPLP